VKLPACRVILQNFGNRFVKYDVAYNKVNSLLLLKEEYPEGGRWLIAYIIDFVYFIEYFNQPPRPQMKIYNILIIIMLRPEGVSKDFFF